MGTTIIKTKKFLQSWLTPNEKPTWVPQNSQNLSADLKFVNV